MKGRVHSRPVGVFLAAIPVMWVAACSHAQSWTSEEFPEHMAPFTLHGDTSSLTWVDNSRIAYSRENTVIWNVESGEIFTIPDQRVVCAAQAEGGAVIRTEGRTLVPPQGPPPAGDPQRAGVHPVYWGPVGRQMRLGADQERTTGFPAREYRLSTGVEVKQWFTPNPFTNCLGVWLPNESTPAHMVAPMQIRGPLFGGELAIEPSGPDPRKRFRVYLAERPTAIELPFTRCDVEGAWGDYHAFKDAYLAFRSSGFDPDRNQCRPTGWQVNRPLEYWWLDRKGRLERGDLPPWAEAVHLARGDVADPKPVKGGVPTQDYVPTKAGFVLSVYFLFQERKHFLFIVKDGHYRLFHQAREINRPLKVSPDGCRIAFTEGSNISVDGAPRSLKVIDLCQAANPQSPSSPAK